MARELQHCAGHCLKNWRVEAMLNTLSTGKNQCIPGERACSFNSFFSSTAAYREEMTNWTTFFKRGPGHGVEKTSHINPPVWGLTDSQLTLIKHLVEKNNIKTALDAACGSGEVALALSGLGVDVTALGTEQGMIESARRKSAGGRSPAFLLGDMRDVSGFNLKKCDLITCMGNSISYLLNTDDMLGTLAQFYTLLRPGGIVLIHTLNYDFILEEQVKWFPLPELTGEGLTVTAGLDLSQASGVTKLVFNFIAAQLGKTTGGKYEIPIKPVLRQELNIMLCELGFKKIKNYFGDCKKFDCDCLHNITVAYRPARPEKQRNG